MLATDASPAFGFGFCVASTSPELVRATAAATSSLDSILRLTQVPWDDAEKSRPGCVFRLPLTMGDFKPVFSIKAKELAHSGVLELEAVKLGLLRYTRCARRHSHRGVIMVDARAVGGALQKGRTSAGTLKRGIRSIAALSLACDLKLSFPYLPSESNPADFPSRGRVYRRTTKSAVRKPKRCSLELLERAYRKAARRWRACGLD